MLIVGILSGNSNLIEEGIPLASIFIDSGRFVATSSITDGKPSDTILISDGIGLSGPIILMFGILGLSICMMAGMSCITLISGISGIITIISFGIPKSAM